MDVLIGVAGAVWGAGGAAFLAAVGTTPRRMMLGLMEAGPASATLGMLLADNVISPAKLFLLPVEIGLDLSVWTIGSLVWAFSGHNWPGAALGALLAPRPSAAFAVVVLASALAGVALCLGARLLLRPLSEGRSSANP